MGTPRPYIGKTPLEAILAEREYQKQKWGDINHDLDLTFAEQALILSREVGEAMQSIGRLQWPDLTPGGTPIDAALADARSELVQVAAVAVAIIEVLDDVTPIDLEGLK